MIIPAVEAAFEGGTARRVGVLATQSTVDSRAYEREGARICPAAAMVCEPAPLLVPLIENDGMKYIEPVLRDYVAGLTEQHVDRIILGCTHYSLVKAQIRRLVSVPVLAQDEIVPEKLADYLRRHPEIETKLSRRSSRTYRVTDLTPSYERLAQTMSGEEVRLEVVSIG
jgi:glutamate racemase